MITLRHTAAQINTAAWCQGSVFSHAVYGQLGRLEVADTLTVIRELLRGHKYIDPDRWILHSVSVTHLIFGQCQGLCLGLELRRVPGSQHHGGPSLQQVQLKNISNLSV